MGLFGGIVRGGKKILPNLLKKEKDVVKAAKITTAKKPINFKKINQNIRTNTNSGIEILSVNGKKVGPASASAAKPKAPAAQETAVPRTTGQPAPQKRVLQPEATVKPEPPVVRSKNLPETPVRAETPKIKPTAVRAEAPAVKPETVKAEPSGIKPETPIAPAQRTIVKPNASASIDPKVLKDNLYKNFEIKEEYNNVLTMTNLEGHRTMLAPGAKFDSGPLGVRVRNYNGCKVEPYESPVIGSVRETPNHHGTLEFFDIIRDDGIYKINRSKTPDIVSIKAEPSMNGNIIVKFKPDREVSLRMGDNLILADGTQVNFINMKNIYISTP